jgi:hypothetical protein
MVSTKMKDVAIVEQRVRQRVWGQISDLTVQVLDGGVLLRGRAPTYYLKQLAQEAVFGAGGFSLVANKIEVAGRN